MWIELTILIRVWACETTVRQALTLAMKIFSRYIAVVVFVFVDVVFLLFVYLILFCFFTVVVNIFVAVADGVIAVINFFSFLLFSCCSCCFRLFVRLTTD